MGKIYFKYGTMASSKTANLLMTAHNYKSQGYQTILISPTNHRDKEYVSSRVGIKREVDIIMLKNDNFIELLDEFIYSNDLDLRKEIIILIDEVQFLTEEQIIQLSKYPLFFNKLATIICSGLLIDFKGQLFEASKKLIEIGAKLQEVKGMCTCGNKATHHLRVVNGEVVREGRVEVHEVDEVEYKSVCYTCYLKETSEMINKII